MSEINAIDDSFLDTQVAETAAEPVVETETVETTETAEVTETVETKPEETTDEVKAEESTTDSDADSAKKEPWTLTAVMDERQKRQAIQEERDQLLEKLEALQPKEEDVSVFDDESKFKENIDKGVDEKVYNVALGLAKAYAERELTPEVVAEAEQWWNDEGIKSPYVVEQVQKSQLKFHTMVDMMNEDKVRRDPASFKEKLKAEALAELKAELKAESDIAPSLASSRSADAAETTVDEDFEDMLGD